MPISFDRTGGYEHKSSEEGAGSEPGKSLFWGYEKAHFFHLYRVGSPDLSRAKATLFTVFCVSDRTTRKWHPTPLLLPGESQGWGAWWAAVYGVAQSRTRLKRLGSSGPDGKASVYNVGDLGSIPGSGRCLQKEKATHSSTLA